MTQLPIAVGPLTLRRWRTSDVSALVAEANSRAVWRNMIHHFPHPYTEQDALSWVDRCQAQDPPLDLVLAREDRLIGVCGVRPGEGVSRYTASVGYWLGEAHWGRGTMTAAFAAFLAYVWDTFDVERLQAEVFAWNPGSARVLEKNGFRLEGTRRRAIFKDGELIDESMYTLFRSQIEPQ